MKVTLDEMAEKFDSLTDDLVNPGPLLKSIGVLLVSSTRQRFKEGRAPSGRKWRPVSQITRRARRKRTGLPLMDTGMLKDSVNFQVSSNAVTVGTPVKHADVHQRGKLIKAKRAKMLAIPLRKEARARGPREFKNLFVWRKAGKVFLVKKTGTKKSRLRLMYLLKKQVKIPARPFIGISKEDERDMSDLVLEFIGRSV